MITMFPLPIQNNAPKYSAREKWAAFSSWLTERRPFFSECGTPNRTVLCIHERPENGNKDALTNRIIRLYTRGKALLGR
jgi:hypothetical protein